jgi:hypothetical protein
MRLHLPSIRSAVAVATVAIGFIVIQPAGASAHRANFHGLLHGTPKHAVVTTTTKPVRKPPVVHHAAGYPWGVTPAEIQKWTRVAVCEEGGWVGSSGSVYPDSLGISASNWYANGGGSNVSPTAQVRVAKKVIASVVGQYIQGTRVYPGFVPDQHSCSAW